MHTSRTHARKKIIVKDTKYLKYILYNIGVGPGDFVLQRQIQI